MQTTRFCINQLFAILLCQEEVSDLHTGYILGVFIIIFFSKLTFWFSCMSLFLHGIAAMSQLVTAFIHSALFYCSVLSGVVLRFAVLLESAIVWKTGICPGQFKSPLLCQTHTETKNH